jgi:hypothetical protein
MVLFVCLLFSFDHRKDRQTIPWSKETKRKDRQTIPWSKEKTDKQYHGQKKRKEKTDKQYFILDGRWVITQLFNRNTLWIIQSNFGLNWPSDVRGEHLKKKAY